MVFHLPAELSNTSTFKFFELLLGHLKCNCSLHGHECDGNLGLLRISVHFPGWNDCSVDIFNEFILDFYF